MPFKLCPYIGGEGELVIEAMMNEAGIFGESTGWAQWATHASRWATWEWLDVGRRRGGQGAVYTGQVKHSATFIPGEMLHNKARAHVTLSFFFISPKQRFDGEAKQ